MRTASKTVRFSAPDGQYEAVGQYRRGKLVAADLFIIEGDERRIYALDVRPEMSTAGGAAWLALETRQTTISIEQAKARSEKAQRAKGWNV